MKLFSHSSTCTNGTFACGKESCEEQIICPKNQVYRKGVTACRKTCELYGREMVCDSDVLMDGCVCDDSNNQTTYMAPDVSHISWMFSEYRGVFREKFFMYFGQLGSSETEYRNHRNYVWMQDSLFKFLKRHNRYLQALDLKKKHPKRIICW